MLKKLLIPISLSLLGLLSWPAYTSSAADNATLARQCHALAENLVTLRESQTGVSCAYKMNMASRYAHFAGEWITGQNYPEAKAYLWDAVDFLSSAEKMNCEKIIQITSIKNELKQIDEQIK